MSPAPSRPTLAVRCFMVILCCAAAPLPAEAHTDSTDVRDTSGVNGVRIAVVGGTVAAAMTAIHIYQANAWWRTARAPFHVQEDLVYARNIDKLGHFYGASVATFILSRGFRWANMTDRASLIWGAVGSSIFQTYIEVEDGFSAYWGFDRVDFAADMLGAWYPVLQDVLPPLQSVNMRFSYLPKSAGSRGAIPGQQHNLFDDYEGQTLWLTLTMKDILPDGVAHWWPGFLCLSVGVAVRDNNSPDRYLAWYLAPDLDMTKIISPDTPFLKTLGEALNFIHFPMPAVRFAPNVVWYGVYF